MATPFLTAVLRQVRKLAGSPPAGPTSDAELLERFVRTSDAAAFEALVARHGALVWRVCRRVLGNDHDAEDAWQATFLVLARGARSVRNPGALAGWLHGVAFRLAQKARLAAGRRRTREQNAVYQPVMAPCQEAAWRELGRLIEEAVHALPERYKAPILLCYWQGRTNEEAARQLGWAPGTLKARLAKARRLLHERLRARGVTLPAGVVALLLAPGEAAEAMPLALGASRASAVLAEARGELGSISAKAAALAGEVLTRTGLARVKLVLAFLLLLGAAGVGVSSLVRTPREEPKAPVRQAPTEERGTKRPYARLENPRTDLYGDALPPGVVARLGTVRLRHGEMIRGAVFAPDGKTAASHDGSGFADVWDLATGKEIRRFRLRAAGVQALRYTAASRLLALVSSEEGIQLWDVNTGQPVGKVMRTGKEWPAVDLSGDGKLAITAERGESTIRVWDTTTGKELRQIATGHAKRVQTIQLSPDGRLVASTAWTDGAVRLHDAHTGVLRFAFASEDAPDGKLAFAANGRWIAGVRRQRSVLLWNSVTGKVVRRFQPPREYIDSVAFTGDGKTLISGGDKVRFWEVATGKSVRQFTPPARSGAHVALAPDGRMLATWGDCELVLWDLQAGRQRRVGSGHQGPVHGVAVSPNGRLAATTCFGDAARLWDLATGRELRQFPGLGNEGTAGVVFSPDGRLLAAADVVKTVRLWNMDTGAEVRRLTIDRPLDVAFSADGKVLLTKSWNSVVQLWDPATGKELRKMDLAALRSGPGDGHDINVAMSPDGQWLAVVGSTVELWRLDTGKLWRRLTEPMRDTGGPVAFSPDGRLLAVRDVSKHNDTIQLWEAASGKEIGTLCDKHSNCLTSIAFSPDGRMVAAGSLGRPSDGIAGELVLWDLASGKEIAARADHRGWLLAVAFSPDGRRLISGAYDTTALVWDVPTLARGARPAAVRVAPKEIDSLWTDLTGADAARAWQAVWKLAANPKQALPLLRRHLRPVPAPAAARIATLLADLDSKQFSQRARAARELEMAGAAAAPILRKTLKGQPTLETRRRLEQILERWEGATPAHLIAVRATTILEQAGSADARQLLDALAGGAPAAHLTREARASLQRLAKRATAGP